MHYKRWRISEACDPADIVVQNPRVACSVEGCERLTSAKGWCGLHYDRWRNHDDPLWEPPTFEDRFWKRVDKDGPTVYDHLGPCWVWTGARTGFGGYGSIGVSGCESAFTHRVSWVLHFGEIPADLWVLHHCDNPPCVNPAHLWLGTHQDNMDDMRRKRRGRNAHSAPRASG